MSKTLAIILGISLLFLTASTFEVHAAKSFTASISPTQVNINQNATYSMIITSTGENTLGSANITIPAGFTILSNVTILNPATLWNYSLSATSIFIGADSSGSVIQAGENVTFTFDAMAPSSPMVANWTVLATSNFAGGGVKLELEGEQPTVTVTSLPFVSPNISASPNVINNDQVSFISQLTGVSGGTPPYAYQWLEAFDGGAFSPIAGANGSDFVFSPTPPTPVGTWSFKLNVTDNSTIPQTVTSNTVNVLVNSALVAPQVTADPNTVTQNQPSTLNSSQVTTGTFPYTYQWFQKAPGDIYTMVGDNSNSYSFPGSTTIGNWEFILQVTDSTGASVNSSAVSVTVVSTPVPTITVTQATHGTINPGTISVSYGSDQSFIISADVGYYIADVLVDGISVGAVASFNFVNVTSDHSLTAIFTPVEYTLDVSVTGDGSVILSPDQATYHYGDVVQLTAIPTLGWRFSVWSGDLVGSLNPSTVTIDGNKAVAATFVTNQYTITASAGVGGSISPSGVIIVDYGGSQFFTITPNLGYHIVDVLVNGTSLGPVSSYNVADVTGDTTISASFGLDSFTIVASAGVGGSISPSGVIIVDYGGSQFFTITPNLGYHIVDVLVNGTSLGPVSSYNVADVTGDTTISASFGLDSFTIVASAGVGGSISPNGTVSVPFDSNQSFVVSPDSGYHVADVLVDGVSVGAVTSYVIPSVASDHTIVANFTANSGTYHITVASTHGSPTPSAQVNAGDDFSVTVTSPVGDANHRWICTGYSIDSGVLISGTSYTFTNVQSDHTITFNWQEQYYLTVISPVGSTTGEGWYDVGTTTSVSVSSTIVSTRSFTREVFVGWSSDASGVGATSAILTIDSPKTATATWKTQYRVDYATSGNVLEVIAPIGEWVDSGSPATRTFPTSITNSAGDTRTILISDDRPSTVSQPLTVMGTYQTQYLVLFSQNGVDSDVSGIVVTALNGTKTFTNLPESVWINAGDSITFSYIATVETAETGKQYILTSSNSTSPFKITEPTIIQGAYQLQLSSSDFVLDTFALIAIIVVAAIPISVAVPIVVKRRRRAKRIMPILREGGVISPSTVQTIDFGGDSTVFIIAANDGYEIDDVVIDNAVHLGAVRTYKFVDVTRDHTITAIYRKQHLSGRSE